MKQKFNLKKILIIGFWIGVWQIASLLVGNHIFFVGPVEVTAALLDQCVSWTFWWTILCSFGKISLGFLAAFALGILIGALAYAVPVVKELLEPVILLIKSVPVASFVILALIWMGSKNLSVLISFLVVLPMIYVNTVAGLESADPKLLEMGQVFHMTMWRKLIFIYRPALMPYLKSSCRVALGMSWKSGIAAEVIGVPDYSIGGELYMAKIYLSTAELFAWTFVVIVISAWFEKLFLFLLDFVDKRF